VGGGIARRDLNGSLVLQMLGGIIVIEKTFINLVSLFRSPPPGYDTSLFPLNGKKKTFSLVRIFALPW